jgi:glycosyltransferase involved in cell wall biosynthesis
MPRADVERAPGIHPVHVSIVTPSFRNSEWLKLCIASVADQEVGVEHIVQDAGSDDGTLNWLVRDARVKAFIERDRGMYDAINRGLRRARGDIMAYLNCDEQYLPGALPAVLDFFERHPTIDVVFGDFVVVDGKGDYLFHRKVQTPLKYHTWVSHLQTFTCAMFFRRKLVTEHEILFDPNLRDVGDGEWMLRLLKRGTRMAVLRKFTSTFTMTGANMSARPNAQREALELFESAPLWARKMKRVLVLHHRLRRLAGGIYFQKPFSYALYSQASPHQRVLHKVDHPTFKWTS